MLFSEQFQITRGRGEDWFDPDLSVDTRLFVDPFLLLSDSAKPGIWKGAHDELLTHFAACYTLLSTAPPDASPRRKAALSLLQFPEPHEFCIGYTSEGTKGSGGGRKYAGLILESIVLAISAGLTDPQHIEEIGILQEGIGADRISDAECNVLKSRFILYTQRVARRHGVNLDPHDLAHAACDLTSGRWMSQRVMLPTSPVTGGPILLVPRRFLNRLPVLNADDWFASGLNDDVRRDMNLRVGAKVSKKAIVAAAQRHPGRIREWAREIEASGRQFGYDFSSDPLGVVRWHEAEVYAAQHPLQAASPKSVAELERFVQTVIDQFRNFIEQEGGWRLLWNDDKSEKYEEAAQLAFLGLARGYCRAHGVELDREVQLGRGPVDFKIAKGTHVRLLLEMKKLHNGDFWNGLDEQLTSYMVSDQCESGWLLAIQYRTGGISDTRARELPGRVGAASRRLGKTINYSLLDGRHKVSASKIRPKP